MYFHVFSDIHLEFCKEYSMKGHINKNSGEEINLILAGDIGYPESDYYKNFIRRCSKLYSNVFVIAGNHEYYKKTLEETNILLNDFYENLKNENINNVFYLNNKMICHNDIYIIGSTLWSYVDDTAKEMIKCGYAVNDYNLIKNYTADVNNNLYQENYNFLETSIKYVKEMNKKCIVITHHLPSFELVEAKFKEYGDMNKFFASDCNELIQDPVLYWIYGHTHSSYQKNINNVNMMCNPKGYMSELSKYNKKLIFQI